MDAATDNSPPARLGWVLRTLSRLPLGVLYVVGGALAWLARYVVRYRVAVARQNLRSSFPDWTPAAIERTLNAHYRQLGQIVAEFIALARFDAEQVRARVHVRNPELVRAEVEAGHSVMLLGAHQCNWEWHFQSVVLTYGLPVDAAYKPLHSAAADRQLRLMRTRFGGHLIAAKRLPREIARRRREQRLVAMLADQVPASSDGRLWLTFLGRPTAFYPGPGQIAHATGFAAFFTAIRRVRRGAYECELIPLSAAGEKLDPAQFTDRYARCVEQEILASPADWTWTHRRWKLPPPVDAPVSP